MERWQNNIILEDFEGILKDVAEEAGVEAAIRIWRRYSKQTIYIIDITVLEKRKKYEYIKRNFNGSNYSKLAFKTGYSERYVRKLLRKK